MSVDGFGPISFTVRWSEGMQCCRSDWPGLCVFYPCVLSFFYFLITLLLPPPPRNCFCVFVIRLLSSFCVGCSCLLLLVFFVFIWSFRLFDS